MGPNYLWGLNGTSHPILSTDRKNFSLNDWLYLSEANQAGKNTQCHGVGGV